MLLCYFTLETLNQLTVLRSLQRVLLHLINIQMYSKYIIDLSTSTLQRVRSISLMRTLHNNGLVSITLQNLWGIFTVQKVVRQQ